MKVAGLFKYVSLLAAMFHIEQLFCKLQEQQFADGQQNKFSWKFRNIHRRTPVLEPLFDNFAL